jgi:hypothetical protein
MPDPKIPRGLLSDGAALWRGVVADFPDLDAVQLATLEAACRQCDRAAGLAEKAAAGDASALRHEREASLAMARLVAALRLPDARGKRPQLRSIRGVHQPPAKLSSLERAAQRAAAKKGRAS